MKKRRYVFLFIICFLMMTFVSCSESTKQDSAVVSISEKNLQLKKIGETQEISATVSDKEDVDNSLITWTTTDENVAIYENGVVRAVGYGYCVIRANYKNVSASCRVKVWNSSLKFSLSEKSITFSAIDETMLLEATELDGQIVTGSVTWSTSNSSIAVCQNGVVTAKGYGSCIIQATLNSQVVKCLVTVNNPNNPSVNIKDDDISLSSNEQFSLSYTTTAITSPIKWISSDEEVASCVDGIIYAKKQGVAVITAVTENGKTDSCVVNVDNFKSIDSVPGYINLKIPEIPKEVAYISSATGQIATLLRITSFEVLGEYGSDGRFYILIKLHGTKTFDIDGVDSTTPLILGTNLYKEENVWCSKELYKVAGKKVGDNFTIDCKLFIITLNDDGTPREFSLLMDDAMEI